MAHASSIAYDAIRELDEATRGDQDVVPEMSIASYMMAAPFKEVNIPVKMEHIRNIMLTPTRVANSRTRIKVKNIHTDVSFEFTAMINSARFVGVTNNAMRYAISDEQARVYCVDGEEYVFVYDDEERPIERGISRGPPLVRGLIEVVSSTGRRTMHYSYLSAAKNLGLLIGHVIEEENRARRGELAKGYVVGKEVYTIEFDGKRRDKSHSKGIRCCWKGIYDGEKIHRVNVTR